MKKFIVFLLSLLIITSCSKKEVRIRDDSFTRAVWFSYVDYRDLMSNLNKKQVTKKVESIVETLNDHNINTLYLHAVAFTDAFYASSIYEKTNIINMEDFDPLEIFIDKAKKYDIRVEAWINPMRSYTQDEVSLLSDSNIIKKWILEDKPYIRLFDGRYYLNPAYDEVNSLILSVVNELIENYDISGIHMDDYFYPSGIGQDFDQEIFTDRCDSSCDLATFRKDNVNQMVAKINKDVKKNGLRFGISPSGNMEYSINSIYGDVKAWVDAGLVDYLIPQIYWGYNHPTKPYLATSLEWLKLQENSDVEIMIGLAAYKIGLKDEYAKGSEDEWINNSDILRRQTLDALENKAKGIAIFSYQWLFEPKPEVKEIVDKERENLKNIMSAE